jgi:hypothetical protein
MTVVVPVLAGDAGLMAVQNTSMKYRMMMIGIGMPMAQARMPFMV